MVFFDGVENNLSNSSFVRYSTILGSAFIKSIAVGERDFIHFFSQYFKKALKLIIYALAVFTDMLLDAVLYR
jgi:hypothetical protein